MWIWRPTVVTAIVTYESSCCKLESSSQRIPLHPKTEHYRSVLVKMEEKALELFSTFSILTKINYQMLASQQSAQNQDILTGTREEGKRENSEQWPDWLSKPLCTGWREVNKEGRHCRKAACFLSVADGYTWHPCDVHSVFISSFNQCAWNCHHVWVTVLGKKKLGQGEDTKKYIIHSLVLKPLPLFSNRGGKTQAQLILS